MPPPLLEESDTESVAEAIPPDQANPSGQVDHELKDAVPEDNEEEEEDDEEDDLDGEEYIVETILDHRSDFDDGVMRYNVKWKGYPKKSDHTWETGENLESARQVLEAYWKKIGGKPTTSSKVSKKRSRQSLSGNGSTNRNKKQKQGRKSTQTLSLDQTPEPPAGFTQVGDDDWEPPAPNKDAWDPLVQSIDTIERDDDGELWAYLLWNDKNGDGRFYRSKARVPTCNQACPQRMLQFYEKHVVFTQNRSSFVDSNGQVA